jgi:hypothetical protein
MDGPAGQTAIADLSGEPAGRVALAEGGGVLGQGRRPQNLPPKPDP